MVQPSESERFIAAARAVDSDARPHGRRRPARECRPPRAGCQSERRSVSRSRASIRRWARHGQPRLQQAPTCAAARMRMRMRRERPSTSRPTSCPLAGLAMRPRPLRRHPPAHARVGRACFLCSAHLPCCVRAIVHQAASVVLWRPTTCPRRGPVLGRSVASSRLCTRPACLAVVHAHARACVATARRAADVLEEVSRTQPTMHCRGCLPSTW
jgi:hypothetical protein